METQRERKIRRFVRAFWITMAALGGGVMLLFMLIALGAFGPMPSFEDLENPNSNLASEVLADDNTVLGGFYVQNRSYCDYTELSPHLVEALISTEDARFYSHSGIDARGLGRVRRRLGVVAPSRSSWRKTCSHVTACGQARRWCATCVWVSPSSRSGSRLSS